MPKKCDRKRKFKIRQINESKLVEPYNITLDEIARQTNEDKTLKELSECIKSVRSIRRNKRLKDYKSIFNDLSNHTSGVILKGDLILIPQALQEKAIEFAHEGHLGIVLCKRLLRNRCWWPGMDRQIKEKVENCVSCQANVDTSHHEPLIPTQFSSSKLGLTSVDFSSRTPTGEYLLVIMYETGRLPVIQLASTMTSREAVKICTRVFNEHGIPKILKSDNGPAFKSAEFSNFARQMRFTHQNGMVERFMRPINKAIRCAKVEKVSWKNTVGKLVRNYRATPHTSTGVSPNVFMKGIDQFTKIPTLRSEGTSEEIMHRARINDEKAKNKFKKICRP